MNILIHALPTKMGGAKRHLNNMMNTLASQGSQHRYILVINDEYDLSAFDPSIRILTYPAARSGGFKRIVFDNLEIPRIVRREKIDLLLSFSNIGPFRAPCRHILFEMNALYFCSDIRSLYSPKERLDFFIKKTLIGMSSSGADLLVTPSRSLKNQLIRSLNIDENKIEVLHHAMNPDFLQTDEETDLFDPKRVSFLYPSHLARHKGIDVLLKALEHIAQSRPSELERFEILCTFDREDEPALFDEMSDFIAQKGLHKTLRIVGHVPQEKINAFYAAADYMLYTTQCESFGFSMLEAKIFKLPALCSDIPVNREISKDSALYYRWNDPADLAEKLLFFIQKRPNDFSFEDELLHWSWDKYTGRLLDLIEETYHGGS